MSLARAASVRLGGSVLFLSYHKMVSKMVSDLEQECNTYDILNTSEAVKMFGCGVCSSSAPKSILASVKEETQVPGA